jgi:hypothetical protein
VEVRPDDAPAFQTKMNLASRADHLARLHEGTVFQVKYLPGDPDAVTFDRAPDN